MKRLRRTPAFRGQDGEVVPGSIAEVAYRQLGGFDQWVMIRGESAANPPMIFLHGGPGWAETRFFRRFNASLETCFTIVYWDQRGAGMSYDPSISASSMTVEQFISDLDEVVDFVCERLGRPRVAILGHSWGSVLGPLYGARYPGKVAGYVGCAQIGDWPEAEAASYKFALAKAQRLGNRRAESKLRAIGPPPYGASAVFTERTWSMRLEGGMRPVEDVPSPPWRAGVLDLRVAQRLARLPLHDGRDVAGSITPESHRPGAEAGNAGLFLVGSQGSLGSARDKCGLLRRLDRSLEEARLVRELRARAVRGRARQVQCHDR